MGSWGKKSFREAIYPISGEKVYRAITCHFRALPDFIIVGAQKAGTTSLYEYLCNHPNVLSNRQKESDFFNLKYKWKERWYKFYFPMEHKLKDKITGESSPNYLLNPNVARRIKNAVPNVKIIILLRNPVDRAISHYKYERYIGEENRSFDKALRCEEKRISGGPGTKKYIHYSYKKRGEYYNQVKRYKDVFNEERLMIIESERFFEQTKKVMSEVYEFLEIDEVHPEIYEAYKKRGDRVDVDVKRESIEILKRYFESHNKKLFDLLGRSFEWM